MIKELLKYLLPLCILLVDGYSNMYAGLQQAPACASPIHVLAKSEHPKLARPADDRGLVFRLPDAAKKFSEFVKTISEEKEEESTESVSLKKQPLASGFLTATYASRRDFPLFNIPKNRPLLRFGTLISSHRYLVLRVLRI
jgi:hypothetical protein